MPTIKCSARKGGHAVDPRAGHGVSRSSFLLFVLAILMSRLASVPPMTGPAQGSGRGAGLLPERGPARAAFGILVALREKITIRQDLPC